jgi:hypothetical protein
MNTYDFNRQVWEKILEILEALRVQQNIKFCTLERARKVLGVSRSQFAVYEKEWNFQIARIRRKRYVSIDSLNAFVLSKINDAPF